MTRPNPLLFRAILIACVILSTFSLTTRAQDWEAPGKPIGKVSVTGNLILLELDEGALVIEVAREDDKKPMPPLLLVKSDGGMLYGTTDMATIIERV